MSLFDVIKYSGTDLDSERELDDLPHELFDAYRIAAFTHFDTIPMMRPLLSRSERISGMAHSWADGAVEVDASYHVKQIIFNKVLKEWNDEPI